MITFAAALAGLALSPEQSGDVISTGNLLRPDYNRTDFEVACGSTIFQARFRNGPEEHGRVDRVIVNGRRVRGAAETLQIRAARRPIESIEIMNCGLDPRKPDFRGVMTLSKAASQSASMQQMLFFRLRREDGKGWQITLD